MTRTPYKGYMPPWSSRRETSGLMGTFLVFLLGLPSHSNTLVSSAKSMARYAVQIVLVFLGLSTPAVQKEVVVKHVAPPAAVVVHIGHVHGTIPPEQNSMFLRMEPALHQMTYIFKGQATFQGNPFPNASVLVRLITAEKTFTKGAVTEADGSYTVEIPIEAAYRAPVDWTMEAYTPDFKKVELAGRKILQREENPEQEPIESASPIIVTNPVEFVVSLSK